MYLLCMYIYDIVVYYIIVYYMLLYVITSYYVIWSFMIIYDPKMLVHDDVLGAWALDHLAEGKNLQWEVGLWYT